MKKVHIFNMPNENIYSIVEAYKRKFHSIIHYLKLLKKEANYNM